MEKISRKTFLTHVGVISTSALLLNSCDLGSSNNKSGIPKAPVIGKPNGNEDIFSYINKVTGKMDQTLYKQIIGSANEFKEGDLTLGISAASEDSRLNARELLANTKIGDLKKHSLFTDELYQLIQKTTDSNTGLDN